MRTLTIIILFYSIAFVDLLSFGDFCFTDFSSRKEWFHKDSVVTVSSEFVNESSNLIVNEKIILKSKFHSGVIVSLFDIMGNVIFNRFIEADEHISISLETYMSLPAGVFFLNIQGFPQSEKRFNQRIKILKAPF